MKTINIIILTLIITINANSQYYTNKQKFGKALIVTSPVIAGLNIANISPFNGNVEHSDRIVTLSVFTAITGVILDQRWDSLFYISAGFDLANAFVGGAVNDKAFDGLYRLTYRNWIEVGALYEYFNAIDYDCFAVQLGGSYQTISAGLLFNSIYNQNTNLFSVGYYGEINFKEYKGLRLSLFGKYDYRPELISKKGVWSSYLTLKYRL